MKPNVTLESLLEYKLLFVSGKGGVGKTTVSLALGLLAAQAGKKTLIAEINSEEQVAHLLGRPPIDYHEVELLPGLWGINILPKKSFEEYILLQIKFQSLYNAVFENRFVRHFLDATPGLADLMCIGKVYELVKDYDLVIVDAPATGHGVALLEIPSIVAKAVRVGPLHTEAVKIDLLLHEKSKTQVVIVTLPEEMPVAETIELNQKLKKLELALGPVFLNQVQSRTFTRAERSLLMELKKRDAPENPLWKILDLQMTRAQLSEEYTERLEEGIKDRPIIPVPFIYSSQFELVEVQSVAAAIEEGLGTR